MKRLTQLSVAMAGLVVLWCPVAAPASPALDAAIQCRRGVSKSGHVYAHRRRVLLLNCADKLLKCEVRQEVDGIAAGACRSKAENSCKNTIGPAVDTPLSKSGAKFDTKVAVFCGAADFAPGVMSNAAGGLWYANDIDCGASADLASLTACLRQAISTSVDTHVGTLSPRAGLLIDNAGLGAQFPDLTRPPTQEVVVAATALDSGVFVSPGTIAVGAGEAVRFVGDAATLPCGGGNNGRVIVTVLTLGAACNDTASVLQEFSFKEPFGPANSATVGPFETDVTYCLNLKDGSCQDEVTDTIDVP